MLLARQSPSCFLRFTLSSFILPRYWRYWRYSSIALFLSLDQLPPRLQRVLALPARRVRSSRHARLCSATPGAGWPVSHPCHSTCICARLTLPYCALSFTVYALVPQAVSTAGVVGDDERDEDGCVLVYHCPVDAGLFREAEEHDIDATPPRLEVVAVHRCTRTSKFSANVVRVLSAIAVVQLFFALADSEHALRSALCAAPARCCTHAL